MSSGFAGTEKLQSYPLFAYSPTQPRGIKLKRSRQRVDAGQPRNSYARSSPAAPMSSPFASSPAPFAALFSPAAHGGPNPMNAFYRLQQQALMAAATVNPDENAKPPPPEPIVESNGNDAKSCDTCEEPEVEHPSSKRSRMEGSGVQSAPGSPGAGHADTSGSAEEAKSEADELPPRASSAVNSEPSPRSKRKSYQPQRGTVNGDGTATPEEAEARKDDQPPVQDRVQQLLEMQRRQYLEWLSNQQQKAKEAGKEEAEDLRQAPKTTPTHLATHKELSGLAAALKSELASQMAATVDRILGEYIEKEAARMAAQARALEASRSQQAAAAAAARANPYSFLGPYYSAAAMAGYGPFPHLATSAASQAANASIFPGAAFGSPAGGSSPFGSAVADASARRDPFASSLFNLSKRKRSKVTDTRLGGRLSGLKEESSARSASPNGYYPPTMVGHPLYGTSLPGLDDIRDNDSPAFSDDLSYDSGPIDPNIPQSATLTPMHLRKAKLMFFYTRYPSSTLIKTYFPDIRFNKNTTAQLVKWFSNFREFYYIQMEKFARQALAEGVRRPEDIHVALEGDLYKTLNQHYNRNNHIQPPGEFRDVVEATLREFFLSIQAGKDAESSWKKQIYKVIARLDATIPDYFKNPHFLDQLE